MFTILCAIVRYILYRLLYRAINIDIHAHDEGGWFMRLPGFKYDDFNRAGELIDAWVYDLGLGWGRLGNS